MALHPVGPLPASTYWLRRAAVLAGVVVLLLLLRSCASGGDGQKPASTTRPTPAPSTTTSAPPQPAPGGPGACPDDVLEVTADTDQSSYPVGASPKLSVTIKNTGSTPCTRDIGSGAVELLVMSGADRVWSSDDCSTSSAKDVVTLAPGAQRVASIAWTGKRSKPRCAGARTEVKAGTYRVIARVGTLREGEAVFRFRG